MATGPDIPEVPDSGAGGAGSPVPPEALPETWQPLLGRPALAELLGHPLASAALTEMRRLLPPHVAVHSLRTFLLADACARSHGTAYDRVGLLAAAAFHDAGLVGRSPLGRGGFPSRSAQLLDAFLAGHEVERDGARPSCARCANTCGRSPRGTPGPRPGCCTSVRGWTSPGAVNAEFPVQAYTSELRAGSSLVHQTVRDMWLNWNRDWARRPAPRK
ncbi:hypothetical protein STENM36S_04238 [Streptomyces tendae]